VRFDSKTNDVDADEVPEKADYYRTQMEAYAIALYQQAPDRRVTATLYFTTPGDPVRFDWGPDELADLESRVETEIHEAMDAIDR
jgi:hypothetical protein